MHKTIKELAELVDGRLEGNGSVIISGIRGIKEAKIGDITFLANRRYMAFVKTTKASAIIALPDIFIPEDKVVIRHKNPSFAFAKLMDVLYPDKNFFYIGIHPTAVIGKGVKLGKDISIQPYVVIEDGASIGEKTVIGAGAFIGRKTSIGAGTLIYPRVTIREKITIGSRCIIHSGTVIGSDGFGYILVKGVHHKIPQAGTVIIEDDVEIGANVTIDRARFDKTWIKQGTKIDNLVQIAHNVVIGKNSIIVAQVGISGSTVIGDNVILAGQAGIAGHINVGDNAIVAAQAGVTKSVPKGVMVSGYPAAEHSNARKIHALVNRLPKLYEKVSNLEKVIPGKDKKH